MPDFDNLSITFLTNTPWLVWPALIVFIALSIILYRRTNPPLPAWLRTILFLLRLTALLALITALLEPVISYARKVERPRRVTVVVDESRSMDREESGRTRAQRTDSLMGSRGFRQALDEADLTTYYFGGNIAAGRSDVDRDRTALGEAISNLGNLQREAPADLVVIFSDGNSNSGRTPRDAARGFSAPIMTVDMAAESGGFDIALREININPVLFAGQSAEVKVRLGWHAADGKTIRVELTDDRKVVAGQNYPISQDDGRGEVTLKYTPDRPGQKLLRVRIPALEGELSDNNNRQTVSVKVLKSRLTVLLVTERPDYEVGFLRRFLSQEDKYDVDLVVTAQQAGNLSGSFPPSQTELNRYDLVVLHDPDPSQLSARQDMLNSYLSERGGAVFVLLGENFAAAPPQDWFNRLLPFRPVAQQPVLYGDFRAEPDEGHLLHPAIRLGDSRASTREAWVERPPFKSLVACEEIDPEGVVLAWTTANRPGARLPLLGYRRFGPGKLMTTAGLPYWTWGFANLGLGGSDTFYRTFLEGTISWLTVQDDFDPIRVVPEKEVFSRGETIQFNGIAYDQGYRPIPEVTGRVTLKSTGADETFETDLIERGEGRYLAEFERIPPGEYRYESEMIKEGNLLKRNEGKVVVESFSLEEFDQSGDPSALMALAQGTGGDYFSFRDFNRLLDNLDTAPITEEISGEIVVWNKIWLLVIMILALAAEWIIRKTNFLI